MEENSIFGRDWWCSAFELHGASSIAHALPMVITALAGGMRLKWSRKPTKDRAIVFQDTSQIGTIGVEGKWNAISGMGHLHDFKAFSPIGQELSMSDVDYEMSSESLPHDYPRIINRTNSGAILAHPFFAGVSKSNSKKIIGLVAAPYLSMEQSLREALRMGNLDMTRSGIAVRRLFSSVSDKKFNEPDLHFCAGRMIVDGIPSLRSATFAGHDVVRNWLYEFLTNAENKSNGVTVTPKDCKVRRIYGAEWTLTDRRALYVWFNEVGSFRTKSGGENGSSFTKLFELLWTLERLGFIGQSENNGK